MKFFTLGLCVLALLQFGYILDHVVRRRSRFESQEKSFPLPFSLALYFLMGELIFVILLSITGIYAQRFFWIGLIGLSVSLVPISVIFFRRDLRDRSWPKLCVRHFLIFVFFAALSIRPFGNAFFVPAYEWDARSIWLFKAKAFYFDNGVLLSFLKNESYFFMHVDYPLFIPLLITGFSKSHFMWSDTLAKAPLFFNWLAYVVIFYFVLRDLNVNRVFRLLSVAVLGILTWKTATNGYADVHGAFFFFIAVYFSIKILLQKNRSWRLLFFAFFFYSASALTKNECLAYSLLALFSFTAALWGNKHPAKIHFSGMTVSVIFLIALVWYGFAFFHQLENDVISISSLSLIKIRDSMLTRMSIILSYWKKYYWLHNSGLGKMVTIPFGFAIGFVMLRWASFSTTKRCLLLIVLGLNALFIVVYLQTPHDIRWHLATSSERVLFVTIPFMILFSAVVIQGLWDRLTLPLKNIE